MGATVLLTMEHMPKMPPRMPPARGPKRIAPRITGIWVVVALGGCVLPRRTAPPAGGSFYPVRKEPLAF